MTLVGSNNRYYIIKYDSVKDCTCTLYNSCDLPTAAIILDVIQKVAALIMLVMLLNSIGGSIIFVCEKGNKPSWY